MTKHCKWCLVTKPLTDFSVNYRRQDRYGRTKEYLKPQCKPCTAAEAREKRAYRV